MYASNSKYFSHNSEMPNTFELQHNHSEQQENQSKDVLEGGALTYYYLNGNLAHDSNEDKLIRDENLSDFYPEAWLVSFKYMRSMFSDY